jgi:LAO/AO transport system kinase
VGQSEVEIAGLADTTVVLVAPGMGDGIQAAKAGVLEVGDVFVVNKADRDGAAATARDLRHMITLAGSSTAGWRRPVLQTVASTRTGIAELVGALERHREQLIADGGLTTRRRLRAAAEIEAIALAELHRRIGYLHPGRRLDDLATEVLDGGTDPYTAADQLLLALAEHGRSTNSG